MTHWILTLLVLLTAPTSRPAGPTTLPADQRAQAKTLADEFAERLHKSRYMESGDGTAVTVPGWEGFPTRRYSYVMVDKDGTRKAADVILLDPTAEQIARWIVAALVDVRGAYDPEAGRKVFKHILAQSGGQFPVAGMVYEDILPADGVNEVFCFRDGVTVQVEGVTHRGTVPLTAGEIEASLTGRVRRVYTYARIQSTSPEQWVASGGSKDVLKDGKPTPKWMDVIRAAYQKAWTSDRNELLRAWVAANVK